MEDKEFIKKYRPRLVAEGIIKSALCGFAVGCIADGLVALITWLVEFDGLWLSLGIGLAVFAALTPVFYFKCFRPTVKQVAERLDRLGLEERTITMLGLEGDQSYMAVRQKEDASAKISSLGKGGIKISVLGAGASAAAKAATVVALVVAIGCGAGMTTLTSLSANGYIPPISEIINPPTPAEREEYSKIKYLSGGALNRTILGWYSAMVENQAQLIALLVSYYDMIEHDEWCASFVENADYGGRIIADEAIQLSEAGEYSTAVTAVPEDGYSFFMWSDGVTEPSRTDIVTQSDEGTQYYAFFVAYGNGSGSGEPGTGEPGEGEPNDSEGEPSESDDSQQQDPQKPDDENEGDGSGDGAGGNRQDPANQIIDGSKYYGDYFEQYYQAAMQKLAEGEELSDEEKAIIELYFNLLK